MNYAAEANQGAAPDAKQLRCFVPYALRAPARVSLSYMDLPKVTTH